MFSSWFLIQNKWIPYQWLDSKEQAFADIMAFAALYNKNIKTKLPNTDLIVKNVCVKETKTGKIVLSFEL